MTDFSHIRKALDTSGKTVEFEFEALNPSPVAIVRPATQSNPEYFERAMQFGATLAKSVRRGKGISRETMAALRDRDYDLYPKYVIVGWKVPPVDEHGNPVEMDESNTKLFLRALPEFIFEELRSFAGNEYNFIDQPEGDPEEHGKN